MSIKKSIDQVFSPYFDFLYLKLKCFLFILWITNKILMMSQTNKTDKSTPKKRSWALMAIEEEYEEEQERLREEQEKAKKMMENRRYLFSIGEYKLEDGEILE